MGSTLDQTEAAKRMDKAGPQFPLLHERPQFRVTTCDFYLGVFAVTNEQFAHFLSETKPSGGQLQCWVSWLDRIVSSNQGGCTPRCLNSNLILSLTSPGSARKLIVVGLGCGCRLKLNGRKPHAATMAAFLHGETIGTRIGFAGGAVTTKKNRHRQWTRFGKAVRRTAFSKWPATSRNGASIGTSETFTSATPQEISHCHLREWDELSAAVIASAKTNWSSAAQCDGQTRRRSPIFFSPAFAALQIDASIDLTETSLWLRFLRTSRAFTRTRKLEW